MCRFRIATLAAAILACSSAAVAQVKIVLNNLTPPAHFMSSEILPQWADEVDRVTQGRVKVESPPAPLTPIAEAWNAVLSDLLTGELINVDGGRSMY